MQPEFLFDFGSPNAYLAHKLIAGIEARTGVRFAYRPILLGGVFKQTNNKSPVEAYAHIPAKLAYEMLEMRRFIARRGLTQFQMNPFFPVNTLLLMRMATAADMEGALLPVVEAGFRHMWEAPKKMDEPDIVRAAFAADGIDADRLMARAQEADVKARLVAATEAAVARGVFGAPSFFVGDELFFGKNTLGDVEEEILRAKAAA